METLLKKAESALSKSDMVSGNLLIYITNIIIILDPDIDYCFRDELGICYQASDGFVLTDNNGKNYSITSIAEHFKTKKYITVDEIKGHSI